MNNQNDYSAYEKIKDLYKDYLPYLQDQMIVIYKGKQQEIADKRKALQSKLKEQGFNAKIEIQQCHHCENSYVELWKAPGIHTCVHAEGVRAGAAPASKTHGEDEAVYCLLNYDISLPKVAPCLSDKQLSWLCQLPQSIPKDKDPIIIAVLDTGFDPFHPNNQDYVWSNLKPDNDHGCYPGDVHGWNFVDNNSEIKDDNAPHWHGTLVSRFIIQEFANSPHNSVQIMTLKTHNAEGEGNLFSSICAIHYAIEKGAQIINASWGFYDIRIAAMNRPSYLDFLITEVLKKKGILFVTAAGNEIDEVDRDLERAGVAPLRDITANHFYPARMSNVDNNVISVTTTDGNIVSPTQNYSHEFVDMGVRADKVTPHYMLFELPGIGQNVSGSSYATAIFSGKIGAYLQKGFYTSARSKLELIQHLRGQGLHIHHELALTDEIRKGRYVDR